ncbi:hypothetical protein OKA06_00300 [Novosphingobium sp. MW5]|nr:hypothetical protein [Novosphingobium sp. MW5]
MRRANTTRRFLIGSSATAILWTSIAAPAFAQQASAPASSEAAAEEDLPADAIVVTGFRAVLRNAINEKREICHPDRRDHG